MSTARTAETTRLTSILYKFPNEMENERKTLSKRNVYDYNKMLEDFQLRDSIIKDRKKRLKHLVDVNRHYKTQVQSMKTSIIQNEQDKIDKTRQEIETRNQRHIAQKQINLAQLQAKKERMNRDAKGEHVRKQHKVKLLEEETKRIKEAERTKYKLSLYTEVSLEHKLQKQQLYEDKFRKSNEFYLRNIQIRNKTYEKELEEKNEKEFKRYTWNYFFKKKQLAEKKKKQNKKKKHLELVQEILEREEEKRKNDRERFINKLNRMSLQRNELSKQNNIQCQLRIQEFKRKFAKTKKNLRKNQKEENELRESTLEFQRVLILRGKGKDDAHLNNKYLARENAVLTQMETEKKIAPFNKVINKIMDQSIMKKNNEQREQIYKDILKAEADKKKKAMEEKKYEGN